ncbi:hypothetical protein [Streptomyces sp. NPDC088348]|uniref:hypothetical protein n=1 Tax=Streptomyces sp. NPDC088348 TaxID=3365853 RepID=UPI00382FD310
MSTFYRVHWTTCSPFTAANAWSSLTGIDRSADGTKSECQQCGGDGEAWSDCPACDGNSPEDCERCEGAGVINECTRCDGTGWEDCLRGYSAFESPEQLIAYYYESGRNGMVPADEPVVVFEGWQADTGFDDEPTAVPEHVIETLPWAEFIARHQDQEATA